jgi:hypothetical protein
MSAARIRRVKVDLTGSNVPDAFSVDVKLLTAWPPERIRLEAARYYAVPLDQVGPVRKSNGQRVAGRR